MGFERLASLSMAAGENNPYPCVIDAAAGFAYFGTLTTPGRIVKIQLSDFTRVGAITLESGEDSLGGAAIDQPKGLAYFGCEMAPGKVVKVDIGVSSPLLHDLLLLKVG